MKILLELLLIFISWVVAGYVVWKKGREEHYDERELFDFWIAASLWGIIASRLLYVFKNFGDFGLNLWFYIAVWLKPGFLWPGLLVGVLIVLWKESKKMKQSLFDLGDLLGLGLTFTKVGLNLALFVEGGLVGKVTNVLWGINFAGLVDKRHPVALYGVLLWVVTSFILNWIYDNYRRFVWYQKSKSDTKSGLVWHVFLLAEGVIGLILLVFIQNPLMYGDVNVDLILRFILVLWGLVGIYWRSGLRA